jgi:hypothetical protein
MRLAVREVFHLRCAAAVLKIYQVAFYAIAGDLEGLEGCLYIQLVPTRESFL